MKRNGEKRDEAERSGRNTDNNLGNTPNNLGTASNGIDNLTDYLIISSITFASRLFLALCEQDVHGLSEFYFPDEI